MKALERFPQKPKITPLHLIFNKGISTSIPFSYPHHPAVFPVLLLLRADTFTMDLLEKYASLAIQDWTPLHITFSSIVQEWTSNRL
ncbi:hypothetical protein ABG768_012802, partial [Culter alburnus]